MKNLTVLKTITAALLLGSGIAVADEVTTAPVQTQSRQMLGKKMMSQEEREEQRDQMRNAATNEERERIRTEQHEKMKARAEEKGESLPDDPPARRQGGGKGNGMDGGRGGMGGGYGGMGGGRGGR